VRRKLLLSYLSVTLFVLLALELPLGLSFANAERRRLTGQVQTEAFAVALRSDGSLAAARTGDASTLARLAETVRQQTAMSVMVVDARGRVVATAGPGEPPRGSMHPTPEVDAALRGRETTVDRAIGDHDGVAVAVPVLAGSRVVGAVRVSASLALVGERTQRNWLLLLALGGVVALVVLLVSVLLARSFTRPLAELDAGAAALGNGNLATRVSVPDDPPELNGLARSFNATAERLEALVRSQQEFVADASHQLRTPLAALSLRLENLEAGDREFQVEDIEGARAEVARLTRLVDGLLLLARTSDRAPTAIAVEVRPVVQGRLDAWTAVATERGVCLDARVDPVVARIVPGRLEQILDNLLSNALDVAPAGSAVRVRGRRDGARVFVEVRDAGPGMTPEQRRRAFDRFWRADPVRKDRGGFGLGLAIVRRLVTDSGGEVELTEAPGGGLSVRVRLPAPDPVAGPSETAAQPAAASGSG
jgi:signal transduction histidine kinase